MWFSNPLFKGVDSDGESSAGLPAAIPPATATASAKKRGRQMEKGRRRKRGDS
jgi:hypothetical protein